MRARSGLRVGGTVIPSFVGPLVQLSCSHRVCRSPSRTKRAIYVRPASPNEGPDQLYRTMNSTIGARRGTRAAIIPKVFRRFVAVAIASVPSLSCPDGEFVLTGFCACNYCPAVRQRLCSCLASSLPYNPSRHATMILHNRRLQWIHEHSVHFLSKTEEHLLIHQKPLGTVPYLEQIAPHPWEVHSDPRSQSAEKHPAWL